MEIRFVISLKCETAEMAVVNAAMSGIMSGEKPLVKIGHYVLGETLGVGTFGKVKSKQAQVL